MPEIPYDHFAILIFGQGQWKENVIKKISKETKSSFFHFSGYKKDSLSCTCPICNALIKLFDPMESDQYIGTCDLCEPLYKKFEEIKGNNEGMIFFSHGRSNDLIILQNLAINLLSNEKIKKIYLMEIEYKKVPKETEEIISNLKHLRISKKEFIKLLENKLYELGIIYEVFKDKYY